MIKAEENTFNTYREEIVNQIKRSEIHTTGRFVYPRIYFTSTMGYIHMACEVECNCGYLGFIRKKYEFNHNIYEIKDFVLDFEETVNRMKLNFKPIEDENFYQIKIIED